MVRQSEHEISGADVPECRGGIVERSRIAAENGDYWTLEDHANLVEHIRELEAAWRELLELARNGAIPLDPKREKQSESVLWAELKWNGEKAK